MDNWRVELQRISKNVLGQEAELKICDRPIYGDYYTNIAMKCAGPKAYTVALDLKAALKPLEEMIRIQVSPEGFMNFIMLPAAQEQLLNHWFSPTIPYLQEIDDVLETSWTSWRKIGVQKCLQNFGVNGKTPKVGPLKVKCDVSFPKDELWLAILEKPLSMRLDLERVEENIVLKIIRRLHALFVQWDWRPESLELVQEISCLQERRLLCFIGQFDEMVRLTTQTLELNIFNNYLKHIASEMQSYYNVVILNDENLNLRSMRYLLFVAIQNVLKYGLACLGI